MLLLSSYRYDQHLCESGDHKVNNTLSVTLQNWYFFVKHLSLRIKMCHNILPKIIGGQLSTFYEIHQQLKLSLQINYRFCMGMQYTYRQ